MLEMELEVLQVQIWVEIWVKMILSQLSFFFS